MNELYGLLMGFLVLLLLALGLMGYSFNARSFGIKQLMRLLCLLVFVVCCYGLWGGGLIWMEAYQAQRLQAKLAALPSPDVLIQQLQAVLAQKPKSAEGWYLLGRLYASQHRWKLASDAFAKAYKYDPNNEKIRLNYHRSLNKNKS